MSSLFKVCGSLLTSKDKKYKRCRTIIHTIFSLILSAYVAIQMYADNQNPHYSILAFFFIMAILWGYYGLLKLVEFASMRNRLFLKYLAIFIIVISVPFILYFIIQGVKQKNVPLTELTTDQWVSAFGGVLGYVGSCFLGSLALYQNDKQKIENLESQKKLEEANVRAEEISNRLLQLEEAKYVPVIDIVTTIFVHDDERTPNTPHQIFAFMSDEVENELDVVFDCKNVGEAYISKIDVDSIKTINDKETSTFNKWMKSIGSPHINVGMKKSIVFNSLINKDSNTNEIFISLKLYNLLGDVYIQQFHIFLGSVNKVLTSGIAFSIADKIISPPKKELLSNEI